LGTIEFDRKSSGQVKSGQPAIGEQDIHRCFDGPSYAEEEG